MVFFSRRLAHGVAAWQDSALHAGRKARSTSCATAGARARYRQRDGM